MNIHEFDILRYIKNHCYKNQRQISEACNYSLGKVNESLKYLIEKNYLNKNYELTKKADDLLGKNKPTNAIILAAGFGMRMVPINNELPKGILEVYDERLIERLIKQLHEVGIYEIDIIVGFLKEKFEYLIDKYQVNLVYNPEYAQKNNLYSLNLVTDKIANTYILPSDVWLAENPFSETELYSWYLLSEKKDSESIVKANRKKELVTTKNEDGQRMIGVSYIKKNDASMLIDNIKHLAKNDRNSDLFWEEALLDRAKDILVYAKEIPSEKGFEINTYEDLREIDEKSESLDANILDLIAKEMDIEKNDIKNIEVMKKGMTNRSFMFTVEGKRYIMRIPGEGTDELIDRYQEYKVYQKINDLNISDDLVYISKDTGYKITKYIENSRNCDPYDFEEVQLCMKKLKKFHQEELIVEHDFDLFERINFYEGLWEGNPSIFDDYQNTKENIWSLIPILNEIPKKYQLTHIDAIPDNFLLTDDEVRLIDWEYASMQDPHLDIAMFAIYSMYDRKEIDRLIDIYFENDCDTLTRMKIYAYIAISGLLWSNWCEYKRLHGVEFGEYSLRQYRYAKEYYQIAMEEYQKII